MQRDKGSLHDVVLSMRLALDYVGSRSLDEFLADTACSDAVIRRLEIIGEAVKRLSLTLREQHPDIPWQKMAGMRDRLIHGYDDVNLEQVYFTITQVVPSTITQVEAILNSLPDSD